MQQVIDNVILNAVLGMIVVFGTPIRVRWLKEPVEPGRAVAKWLSTNVCACAAVAAVPLPVLFYASDPSYPVYLVLSVNFLIFGLMAVRSPRRRLLELNEAEREAKRKAIITATATVVSYIIIVSLFWALAPDRIAYAVQLAMGFALVARNPWLLARINRSVRLAAKQ